MPTTVNAVCWCGSGKSPRLVGSYYGCDACHPWDQLQKITTYTMIPWTPQRLPDYVPETPST